MTPESMEETSLTAKAKAVIWRIFGAGASPLNGQSSYQLIAPVVRKHLSLSDAERSIVLIRGWFETHGNMQWLRSDMQEAVATIILRGVGTLRTETATWAVGSIDSEVMIGVIRSLWTCEDIDSFVDSALEILEKLSKCDRVLDASRLARSFSVNTKITIDAVEREGRLETFRQLDSHGFDLVHRALHPTVGNLLALIVELRPERFETLITRLDHAVIQARAAHHMVAASRRSDHRATLRWIDSGSSDALIALAIVHTLNTVNRLDEELQLADHAEADGYYISTELRPGLDNLDTAASTLLESLVDRLGVLNPQACTRWIGELLSGASYILHRGDDYAVPRRISQLEKACTVLCARLFCDKWAPDLLSELVAGLRHTPRISWSRHIAEVAWEIRHAEPARAAQIAKTALDEHERLIEIEIERNYAFLDGHDWHHREWLYGLGIALVISQEELDLPCWVRGQCHLLPLSVWDAEEDYAAFSTAHRVVHHWFLVAFHAIPVLRELGRAADPAAVRTLAETLWAHDSFAARHLHRPSDEATVAEYAARYAVEHGAPSDVWLLDHFRNPALGPLSLWALIDQRIKKNAREDSTKTLTDQVILPECTHIAAERFGDGTQFDLETLRHWGLLWLLLGAVDEAEKTATAILAFPLKAHDRGYKMIALKLLALVSTLRTPALALADYTAVLYRELWPGFAPPEERADRQRVDEMLERSVSRIL